jgi:hypothetical protein
MVRTLKLDEEIKKTQNKMNSLQYKNYEIGLSRKDMLELNFAQFKLKQLHWIEVSEDKYVPKEDNKRIKSAFMSKKW